MTELLFLILVVVAVIAMTALWRSRVVTVIYPPTVGLLYRDGRFVRQLSPGRHVRFDPFGRVTIVPVSLAELPTQLGEMTVLSKDQFSFRIGLAPVLQILDAQKYIESQRLAGQPQQLAFPHWAGGHHPAINTLVPAAALEVAGTLSLAEILANQEPLREGIRARIADAIPGAAVSQLLVTAINLPPETRKMFTDVERVKLEGLASLERARSEQAALRVLANAARLLADNPALGNLRLLQAIETSKGNATVIIGESGAMPKFGGPGSSAG